jgi:FO synthase
LRAEVAGDAVTFVVNRNINYTNICTYKCGFCAFSKGSTTDHLRGLPYDLDLDEVVGRTREAWATGATEVCLQGGSDTQKRGREAPALAPVVQTTPRRSITMQLQMEKAK